ncbi:MAG: collagen-like protein, partial [Clostridiales bacterium]|nr:collagen-like protein [Clostridiales bacterium]
MIKKTKLISLLAAALVSFTLFAGCAGAGLEAPPGEKGEPGPAGAAGEKGDKGDPGTATAATASYLPGNFSKYDYFTDVYGLDKTAAYKIPSGELADKPFYFRTESIITTGSYGVSVPYYNPYQTLSYEQFTFLLETPLAEDLGYYAIAFGGEWEAKTKDFLTTVNLAASEVAYAKAAPATTAYNRAGTTGRPVPVGYKDAYINTIYNFDFKVNGGLEIEDRLLENGYAANPAGEYDSDIRLDISVNGAYGSNTSRATITNLYAPLYSKLDVTTNAAEPETSGFISGESVVVKSGASLTTTPDTSGLNLIKSPSLLIIKKTLNGTAAKNTVVGFADASNVDFTKESEKLAFQAKAKTLLEKAPADAAAATTAGLPAAAVGFQTFDYFRYIFGSYTQGSGTGITYARPGAIPTNNFTHQNGTKYNVQYNNLSDTSHVYKFVTYAELIHLFQTEGHYAFYFGGSWCHYSRGFLAPFNQFAKAYDVNQVYFFDPYIDGVSGNTSIRNSETVAALLPRLFANLLTYFDEDFQAGRFPSKAGDWLTGNLIESGLAPAGYDQDLTIGGKVITKMGVPSLFAYGKDNVDITGKPKPVIGFATRGDNFEDIVAEAEEPVSSGIYQGHIDNNGVWVPSGAAGANPTYLAAWSSTNLNNNKNVEFYSNVNYLQVVRTSASGRKAENNIN